MRRFRPVLIALAGLGAAAGCGGESGLSTDELIAQGDQLCAQARREQPPAPAAAAGVPLPALVAYLDKVDKQTAANLAKFRKLKPRQSERKRFDAFLTALERRLASLREARDLAIARNTKDFTAAINAERARYAPAYRNAAKQIGFKVCGSA